MVNVKKATNVSIRSLGAEWQMLAEVTATGETDQKKLAIEQVVETVETFHLPARPMDQLRTAVSKAVLNEVELIGNGTSQPVSIRILASPKAVKARKDPQAFDTRGWGYFLIEKMGDNAWLRGEAFCQLVELFLYLEGEIQHEWKEKK